LSTGLKLLCFDLDDTLWPCDNVILEAEHKLYRWMQQHVPQITAVHDIHSLRDKRISFLREHPDLAHDLTRMRVASMRALADEFGLDHDWIEPGFELYYLARQQVSLFDDVAPVLDALSVAYRLAAITNGNADIHLTGVARWFEFAVTAAEVGQAKPHPDIFAALLERASVNAEDTVLIGDDPHRDIYGASRLGIRTVWVNREARDWSHAECEPDAVVKGFDELPGKIRHLEKSG
jgi:FMN hydrolase / 5-amino-6-(5-phospho-D-ribitylamino)uracil phosphatase